MPGPAQEAENSLSAITEAAEELVLAQKKSAQKKNRAVQALFEASSQPNLASRHFSAQRTGEAPSGKDWNEALAAATLELRSAHVLAAASVTIGETKPVGDATGIGSLETAVEDAKAELGLPQSAKGFRGKVTRGEPSRDVASAIDSFRAATNLTIDLVVNESSKAIARSLDEIEKRNKSILEAFDSVAELFSAGAQLEGLIRAAWEKLQSGLRFLSEILKDIPIESVREQVKKVKDAVSVKSALEFAYQAKATRELVRDMQVKPELKEAEIDDGRDAVAQIGKDFSAFVKAALIVSALASAVAGAISFHLTGPWGLLATPATHALVIAVVLVAGISISNAWVTVRQVHGIRDRIREISVAIAQNA